MCSIEHVQDGGDGDDEEGGGAGFRTFIIFLVRAMSWPARG